MPTPDLSEFDALELSSHPTRCKLARILDELSEQDRANLEGALASERPDTLIVRWFKTKGLQVSTHTLRRHREGLCVCP
jgi:hypothetical protein